MKNLVAILTVLIILGILLSSCSRTQVQVPNLSGTAPPHSRSNARGSLMPQLSDAIQTSHQVSAALYSLTTEPGDGMAPVVDPKQRASKNIDLVYELEDL
jgi:hypothetical protein